MSYQAMIEWIQRLIASKRAYRSSLAALPFEEKIKLLEKLRQRILSVQAYRSLGLEADLLEGVRSPQSAFDASVLDLIRWSAPALWNGAGTRQDGGLQS